MSNINGILLDCRGQSRRGPSGYAACLHRHTLVDMAESDLNNKYTNLLCVLYGMSQRRGFNNPRACPVDCSTDQVLRPLPLFGGCSQSLPERVQTLKNGRPPRPHSGIWHVAAPWIQCPTSRVKTEESDKARILADSQNIWRKIWEILPLQNSNKKPRNNKEKPRKTNEKLRKTVFLYFSLFRPLQVLQKMQSG